MYPGVSPRGIYMLMSGVTSSRPVDLFNINTIYVYSDIGQYQLIGDTQAPLLGILPVEGSHKQQRFWSFAPAYYVPVNKSYITTIEIQLCTDIGDKIPFDTDSCVVTRLHFRRKAPWFGI